MRQRWEMVSSSLAQAALAGAFRVVRRESPTRGWEYLSPALDTQLFMYRDELRRRLAASQIAERLPAGISAFPDIFAALPRVIGAQARKFQPSTYAALARHIQRNLDWYLDPGTAPQILRPPPGMEYALLALGGIFCSLAGAALIGDAALAMLIGLSGFGLAAAVLWLLQFRNIRSEEGHRRFIRDLEFYYYLLESYTDCGEALTLPAADSAEQQLIHRQARSLRPGLRAD